MESVCYACQGFRVGALAVPSMALHVGELVCLHLPFLQSEAEQQELIRLLTGVRRSPAVRCFGRVVWAEPAAAQGGFLPHLFNRQSAVAWLCHAAGISRSEAKAIADRLGIEHRAQVEQLPMNQRNLLGIEAAWARRANVILFTTAGCDLEGVHATYEAVLARLSDRAAIHLSYPYVIASPDTTYQPISPRLDQFAAEHPDYPQVRAERCCFARARCIELTEEIVPAVRVIANA